MIKNMSPNIISKPLLLHQSWSMKEKVVIITGGTSGIGKALAFEFGNHGSKVVITGRRQDALNKTKAELENANIECISLQSDVSVASECEKMVQATLEKFGRIDILINNAGISMRASFEDLKLDVIKHVMDINFYGAVNATKYCLPEIIKNKGSILGISSIAGYRGLPGRAGYSASKFALQGFLEVIRSELVHRGVHVMIAAPSFTGTNIRKTALTADGNSQAESPRKEEKMMTPQEVAKRIYVATRKRKRVLVFSFEGKLVRLLNYLAPGFIDKMVYKAMAKEPDSPFPKV